MKHPVRSTKSGACRSRLAAGVANHARGRAGGADMAESLTQMNGGNVRPALTASTGGRMGALCAYRHCPRWLSR
jgi:hypothetical protein